MDNGRYIRCRNCGAIHHVTPFDRYPLYAFAGGEAREFSANDWRDFMARHAGHRLEPLTSTGNDYFPAGSAFDPMSIGYVEVSNGEETLLLRRSRACIEEPLRYEIVNGQIVQNGVTLEVQESAIRIEMKLHYCWAPAAPLEEAKISLFIALFREVVGEIDAHAQRVSEYSCTDNNTSYCPLDSAMVDVLMAKCRGHFPVNELASLRRFVEGHRDGCDVMALVQRRVVMVEQRAQ